MFQLVIVEDKLKIMPEHFGRDATKVLLELIGKIKIYYQIYLFEIINNIYK